MDVLDAEVLKAAASTLAPGLLIVGVRRQFLAGPRPGFEEQAVLYAVVSALYFAVASPIFRLVEPAP